LVISSRSALRIQVVTPEMMPSQVSFQQRCDMLVAACLGG
jgi:hypothetical protein